MVTSQKKKVTNPGIRQRVLDALTGEPKGIFDVCRAIGGIHSIAPDAKLLLTDTVKRELGVLCAAGLAHKDRDHANAAGCSYFLYTAAPHVLEARRLAGRDQRVAGLLRDAERAESLWFSDEAINDLAAWAGVPQYFKLGDSPTTRRQRIAAWCVLRRALGEAGARHLPLSVLDEERPPELWVRILRAAGVPVWMDAPTEPGVWFTGEGRTVPDASTEPAKLQWVSGARAKDVKWGPETATLLNRACALLRAAGYNVEAPVPAKPGASHPTWPAKPANVCGAFPTKPGDVLRCTEPAGHDAGTHGAAPTWVVGDRLWHRHEHRAGEIVDQRPFDLFKIAFDGDNAADARWVTKSGLDAYYTREPRDAQPPAKIDDDCQAGGRGMSVDEVRVRYGHPEWIKLGEVSSPRQDGKFSPPAKIDGEPVQISRVIQDGPCDPTHTQTNAPSPRQDGKLSPPAGAAYYELLTSGPFGLDRDSEIKARLERAGFKDLDLSAVFEELHAYAGVVYSQRLDRGIKRQWMLPLLAQPSV